MDGTDPGDVVQQLLEALHHKGMTEEVIDRFTSDEHVKASISKPTPKSMSTARPSNATTLDLAFYCRSTNDAFEPAAT